MKRKCRIAIASLLVLALLAVPLLGCGDEDAEEEKVVISVGEITDFTGPGAYPLRPMSYAVKDLARYINEEDPIPGVEIKIVSWDTKYDPARDVPGYDWCRDRGAKIIITPQPHTVEVLKPFAERDKVPILTWAATAPIIEPPGWAFCAALQTTPMVRTLLKWLSEQWPNYPAKPKIGTVGCSEPMQITFGKAVKEYCQAHPDEFEYVGEYLAPMGTMTWSGEVEKLKDCDYIGFNQAMMSNATFIKEFRTKEYTATFIGLDAPPAAKGLFVDLCGWEALDGTLTLHAGGYWGDPILLVELAEELVYKYHPEEADQIVYRGNSYMSLYALYLFFDILREAVEEVGAENFDGQAFYDTAIKFKRTYEGYPEWGFTETMRYSPKHGAIYEWRAEVEDLVRITDWLPEIK